MVVGSAMIETHGPGTAGPAIESDAEAVSDVPFAEFVQINVHVTLIGPASMKLLLVLN